MNEWISHEIKTPIDLKKVDWRFFTGGLVVPTTKEDPNGDAAFVDLYELMIGIVKNKMMEETDYILKDWNAAKLIETTFQPKLTGIPTAEDLKRYRRMMDDYAIYLNNILFSYYENKYK